jgi:hypothetical protein
MFPYHTIHIVTYRPSARQRPQCTCGQQYRSSVSCGLHMNHCYAAHVLGSVKIAHCKKRHPRAQLGFCWRAISNSSNNMVDHQEVTCESKKPWIRTSKGTTGSRQEEILKNGADSATPVQPVAVPGPGNDGAKCTSTMLEPHSKG